MHRIVTHTLSHAINALSSADPVVRIAETRKVAVVATEHWVVFVRPATGVCGGVGPVCRPGVRALKR
jgi:hypothetical protein